MALGFILMAGVGRAGEPIRFSSPAVPLATPAKEPAKLPEPRVRGLDFSAPGVEQPAPMRPPQPIVRVQPDDSKREDMHFLLRTPKMFADPEEQNPDQNKFAMPKLPSSAFSRPFGSTDAMGNPNGSSPRALTPVTDLNWDARDANRRSKDPVKGERYDSRSRNLYSSDDSEVGARSEAGRPSLMRDLFSAHKVEKPNAVQIERRAAFQQLLNPITEAGDRAPNSLQPVVSAAQVQTPGSGRPTTGTSKPHMDPTAVFNQRHEPRASALDELNKKYSAPPAPASASREQPFQTPLNRQPAMRDFPRRIQ